jgi:hypothetical protein
VLLGINPRCQPEEASQTWRLRSLASIAQRTVTNDAYCVFRTFPRSEFEILIEESPAMVTARVPHSPHRHNQNGIWESICSECILTVANAKLETELETEEKDHVCEGPELQRI